MAARLQSGCPLRYRIESGSRVPVYGCVVAGSLLVALWSYYIDPVINEDGVRYVMTANAFAEGNFQDGLAWYKWPFYPLMLAVISKITPLPAEYAALIFGAAMRAVGGIAFIRLSEMLGADKTQVWLAGFVYLFYPGLNEIQSMIMRDIPYIACFLWMMVFFVQTWQRPNNRGLAAFLLTGLLATIFRIEGMVYLGIILFWMLVSGRYTPAWLTRKLAISAALVLLALLGYATLYWLYDGRISVARELVPKIWLPPKTELLGYIDNLAPGMWRSALEKGLYPAAVMLPFAKAIFNFLEILTLGYVLILMAGMFVRPWLDRQTPGFKQAWQCWKIIVVINILILAAFAALRFLYNDRYPLTLSVMTMLLVPFAVTALCRSGRIAGRMSRKTKAVCAATGFVLLINSLEGLDRFTSKHHLREAGTWIRQQTGDDYHRFRIYSNNRILDYYAGQDVFLPHRHYLGAIANPETLKDRMDLIAIRADRSGLDGYYQRILSRIGESPAMTFEGRKGDRVDIFDFREKQP